MIDRQRRIGVFGGTFDPPHVAHLVLAAAAVEQLDLDELLVIPAGVPWQKVGSRSISRAAVRLHMCERAFAEIPAVRVSPVELLRAGDSYTVDTLRELARPGVELFLLLGSDAAAGLDTWHRHEDLASLARIAVFPRRGTDAAPPPGFDWTALELPGLEVSSSDIRQRVRDGRPIAGLVPRPVRRVIAAHGLYRTA